jgi:ElaB/YqjD/DUF883 family membrane-anchored ribosome-binding protein
MTDYDRPNPEVLEDEIERSRERISSDIDQLSERLKPHHLKERAQDALEDRARRAGRELGEFVQDNPFPTLAGVVVGLLVFTLIRSGKRSSRQRLVRKR